MKVFKPLPTAAALAVAALALSAGLQVQAQKPRDEPIQPLEAAKVSNPAKVELGKKLWFDPRLSRSGFISCNSCHNLSMGGSDNVAASVGDRWQKGGINSPTVLNSVLNIAQFWDGRAKDLADQAGGPIANPIEMNSTHDIHARHRCLHAAVHPRLRAGVQERLQVRQDRHQAGHRRAGGL